MATGKLRCVTVEPDENAFGSELRRLRRAQSLSLKQLGEKIGYDYTQISKIETGKKSPGEHFARSCDEALEARGALLELVLPHRHPCPYPGLTSFRAEDARWFAGRDGAVARLLAVLGDPATTGRPVIVIGPSGVGKSSLLRAGLIAKVAAGALPGNGRGSPSALYTTPAADPSGEWSRLDLLVVDQFEELFTLCEEERRREFIALLCRTCAEGVPVVIGLRADFYGHCLAHPELLDSLGSRLFPLAPMSEAELREAITVPAAAAGLRLEAGLVEILLRDLGVAEGSRCAPGALPLLSHALRATWQQGARDVLTVEGYVLTGGVRGAIAATAERVYHSLSDSERAAARGVLLDLVEVGEDETVARRPVRWETLRAAGPATLATVEKLTAARLLTSDRSAVEFSHEALLQAWPRLREWIEADRTDLLARRRLTEAARDWERAGRDRAFLYRGAQLSVAREWTGLEPLEQSFLRAARRRAARGVSVVSAGALVFALAAGGVVAQTVSAAGERRENQADQVAARATLQRPKDPGLAAQLALAAYDLSPTLDARSALAASSGFPLGDQVQVSERPIAALAVGAHDDRIAVADHASGVVRFGPSLDDLSEVRWPWSGQVSSIAFHPARPLLAAAGPDGVAVWDTGTGKQLFSRAFERHHAAAYVVFHPTADLIVTARDRTVASWSLQSGAPAGSVTSERSINGLVFHRGGVVAAMSTVGLRKWDLGSGGTLTSPGRLVHRSDEWINSLTLSPDGHTVAAGNRDGRLTIADLDSDWSRSISITGEHVYGLAFSRDGRTLATGNSNQDIWLWDVPSLTAVSLLPVPVQPSLLAFGAGGDLLLARDRGTVYRLDTGTATPARTRNEISAFVAGDLMGQQVLVTGDGEGRVTTWSTGRLPYGKPLDLGERVQSLAVHGRWLAAGTGDGRIVLADAAGQRDTDGYPRGNGVTGLVFAAEDVLVSVGENHAVWVWSTRDGKLEYRRALAETSYDQALAVDRKRGLLALSTEAGHCLELWDMNRLQRVAVSSVCHADIVATLAFDESTGLLVSGGNDGLARFWRLQKGSLQPYGEPLQHPGEVEHASFDPRSKRLVTATSRDLYVWDLDHRQEPVLMIRGTRAGVRPVFTREGELISTDAGPMRLWDLDLDRARARVCGAVRRPVTKEVWARELGGEIPFRQPCRVALQVNSR